MTGNDFHLQPRVMALKYQLLLRDLRQHLLALVHLQLSAAYGALTDSWAAWPDLKKSESSTDFKNRVWKLKATCACLTGTGGVVGIAGGLVCVLRGLGPIERGRKCGHTSTVPAGRRERCFFPPGCQRCFHTVSECF